ncbi:hypothetical protein DL89DRAFT_270965 [Linderina pennispora]|uniref:Helicase C-terminal domain-containing protein n=1 Tax=Linderina pennispora TaxID=61395 RepID=A0A1Y1VW50_9FUNG|nr:uncharacterized protein DL89DRAFT_270965 [Linderina pennispora]ORX65433.1 hypothetical protein DL89DRAFT_270965 [Linderina pennispora]
MANGQVAQSARSLSAAEILAKIKQAKQPTYTEEETQPEISHVELHSFVRSHLATDTYDAISYYIRQMAMGSASGMADMRMALRLWAEFLSWLNRQQPEIVVAYPDAAASIIEQQIPRDHDCSKVCKGLAGDPNTTDSTNPRCDFTRGIRYIVAKLGPLCDKGPANGYRSSDGDGDGDGDGDAAANDAAKNQDAIDASSTIEVSASESDIAIQPNPAPVVASSRFVTRTPRCLKSRQSAGALRKMRATAIRSRVRSCSANIRRKKLNQQSDPRRLSCVQHGCTISFCKDFAGSTFAARRVLILCPPTVQANWTLEFLKWTGVAEVDTPILPAPFELPPDGILAGDARLKHLKLLAKVRERAKTVITQKLISSGVMVMGYSSFRDHGNINSGWEDFVPDIRLWMLDHDEGHNIKNPSTRISTMANLLRSKSRNNLEEYWTMVDFCYPNFLSNLSDFRNSYINPIKSGLYSDSDASAKRLSTLRMKVLQRLLVPVEYIISCPLADVQRELYVSYIEHFCNMATADDRNLNKDLLLHGSTLTTICNHPAVCKAKLAYHRKLLSRKDAKRIKQITLMEFAEGDDSEVVDVETLKSTADERWTRDIFERHSQMVELQGAHQRISMLILLEIISKSVALGERVLVFSRSIQTMDYIQRVVKDLRVAVGPTTPFMQSGMVRIDGSTPVVDRQMLIDQFNVPKSPHNMFLISSMTGSLGINLVSASRVVIFDVGWNPLYDEQAVARAYRYGQRRRVYVYRLMTTGTWEERLFANNVFKVSMTRRVVDKQTMGRRVNKEDMKKYFELPPSDPPKITGKARDELLKDYSDDVVFASVMASYQDNISSVTPDATLLANEDENLSQEDMAHLEALFIHEKQRLGQLPPPLQPTQSQVQQAMVLANAVDSLHAATLPALHSLPLPTVASPDKQQNTPSSSSIGHGSLIPMQTCMLLVQPVVVPTTKGATTSAPLGTLSFAQQSQPLLQTLSQQAPSHIPEHIASSYKTAAEPRRLIQNVQNERITVTEALLRILSARLESQQLMDNDPDSARRKGLWGLIRSWQHLVNQYLAKGTPGYADRANHFNCSASLFELFPILYNSDDNYLSLVIRQFPLS